MKTLTPQQIQFINNYLKESGVRYDDIRIEMADHVASALEGMEGDFYDNFKNYMLAHKQELLDNNKTSGKASFYRALGVLQNIIITPLFVATWLILLVLYWFIKYSYGQEITSILSIALIAVSLITYGYFIYYKVISNYNNSVIDKLINTVYFVLIIVRADRILFLEENLGAACFYCFSIAFFVVLLRSVFKINRKYKLYYGT
ncbi:hypothetical protein GR160_15330 [Flavobacterium sp. Sd200]|uniref:hypothetical protein n=1 Tax=Flavobacterium sp. Sd200 TaxID=2692211 RepID=UPI00136B6E1B|nr:hypothetical protein [Flavobacterium sp. Sd200]MXN92600.1 hypothetical protein [Flavobacterium sp. Sd200]